MKVIVDCMSGDNAPYEIIKGAVEGAIDSNVDVILVGNEIVIKDALRDLPTEKASIEIYHTDAEPLTMEDDPSSVMKAKKDSSMAVSLRLLSEGVGHALVCAGNTGALFTGANLIVKRIKGIRRAALGAILPPLAGNPIMIADAGANVEVTPENLCEFAVMADMFMEKVMHVENPRIGLINNGAEEHKGTEVYRTAHALLKEYDLNFIGNVEGRDFPEGVCDVLVCDGFTGNVVLKLTEGFGLFMGKQLKNIFYDNIGTKAISVLLLNQIKRLKKNMDYTDFGGAPFLGISRPVIKAHGSSNAKSIRCCIRQAKEYALSGIIQEYARMTQDPDAYKKKASDVPEEGQENVPGGIGTEDKTND